MLLQGTYYLLSCIPAEEHCQNQTCDVLVMEPAESSRQLRAKPGLGVRPIAFDRPLGDSEYFGYFSDGQAAGFYLS